ncbi:MAG: hypothetical protein ACTHOH_01775 [Lysobacteraceae bacterium]
MKQDNDTAATFAFRLAETRDQAPQTPWQVREDVAVAGCSGPDARGDRYPGRDNGIYC